MMRATPSSVPAAAMGRPERGWHELEVGAVVGALGTDRDAGLGDEEAARRLR